MKKVFITIIAILLPTLAMGQILYQKDFTGITEFTGWYLFDDSQTDGKVEVDPNGVAITVGIQTGQLWQPEVMVIPDYSFNLKEGGNYKVIINAKFPTSGTLQINMGTWSSNDQAQFPVTATGDFQTIECDFDNWSFDVNYAHLLFECGDFKGTTILKKIIVIDKDLGGTGSDICYNYITKGKIAEVIPHTKGKYYGAVEIPAKVIHEGEEYTVKTIADNAFYDCSGLTSITIPNSVTSLGVNAFKYCTGLTSVTIPNSVTSIGYGAFDNCSGLSSITIPNSVTSIGAWAFDDCSALSSITIPNSVTSISTYVFSGCSSLTSISIPNSVTSISQGAFQGCTGLTSVTIGSGLKKIGLNTFSNCPNLSVVCCMAEKVPSTNTSAFDGSYVEYTTLHVPASALNSYMTTEPWSGFGSFVSISGDFPKCATPTISFENGKIIFCCETEGAEFVSNISTTDTKDYYDAELTPSFKYKVTVYATKSGYDNSDIATVEFEVPRELKGDLNNDGKVNVADHVKLSSIIMDQK